MKHINAQTTFRVELVLLLSCIHLLVQAQRMLPVGTGVFNSAPNNGVYSMVEYDGLLVLGGRFLRFNEYVRFNVQAWDGVVHHDLPGAFENLPDRVRSLAVHDGHLIAAGIEPDFGHIAKWDGSAWSAIGTGFPEQVMQVKVVNDQLHAISIDSAVHRWTGVQWEQLGPKFNGPVLSLEEYQGALYAGGNFTGSQDGLALPYLAYWDGNTWQQAGAGFNAEVRALLAHGYRLHIGGAFTGAADGTGSYPGWCTLQSGVVEPGTAEVGEDGVFGFGMFPDDHLLLFGADGSWLIGPHRSGPIPWKRCRAAIHYNGMNLLAAGENGGDYRHKINGLAEIELSGSNHATTGLNQVRSVTGPVPVIFQPYWNWNQAGFEVPSGSGHNVAFAVHPSLRGELNGMRYYSSPLLKYMIDDTLRYAGPRATTMDEDFFKRYHRVWRIDRAQILAHQDLWQAPGYIAPDDIREWPAHGNPSNGEPLMLAPFEDLNGNGIYEPEEGEYPKIKGHAASYHLTHSEPSMIENYLPPFMPVELQVETHAYGGSGTSIDHTVFSTFRFINRSAETYENVRLGLFTDMFIGCPDDDLVEADTTRNMFFVYNGLDVDEGCEWYSGFAEHPPAFGVKFLNTTLGSHRRISRNPPFTWAAALDDFLDGTVGGVPFEHNGSPSHIQFPGGEFADDLDLYQSPLDPNETRTVAGAGPFNFTPGDTICIDLAFIYARDETGGALESVEALRLRADSAQAFYDAMAVACNGYPLMTSIREQEDEILMQLFPNPARSEVTVQASSPIRHLRMLDAQGRELRAMYGTSDRMVIGVSDLPAGLYFIQVLNDHGMRAKRLVVE